MRIVVATSGVGRHPPSSWLAAERVTVHGRPVDVGLVERASEPFDPADPRDRERVLVQVLAFSLNYRDRLILRGDVVDHADPEQGIGSEFAGEVVAVGCAVPGLRVGQRVMAQMSWPSSGVPGVLGGVATNRASRELQSFHHAKLVAVPETMPTGVAAGFALGAQTAYSMVRRLRLPPGSRVLVTGATSNTSLFTIQALRRAGAVPYALTTHVAAEDRLIQQGAEEVIPWWPADGLAELHRVAASVRGFDAVVDPFSDVHLSRVLGVLRHFSAYVTCGVAEQGAQPGTGGPLWSDVAPWLIAKGITVIGNCLGTAEDLERAIADWAAGRLSVVIDSSFAGEAVGGFVDRTFNDRRRFGKVVYSYLPG